MKTITVKVHEGLDEKLARAAGAEGISKGELPRRSGTMMKRLLITLCLGAFAAMQAAAEPAEPAQSYALLIGGIGGQEPYNRWFSDWLPRFQTWLTNSAKLPAANVTVLSGDAATADAVVKALAGFSQRAKPQDQLILFIVGHGGSVEGIPTLTLKGPDMTAPQLAEALGAVPAKSQVVLNFSASSGDSLKYLVSPNRVNITATSPTEMLAPVFAEFFLRGLESQRADADKDGSMTMLETYNWAAQQTALWIVRWKQTDPGSWKASGKETLAIFEKLYPGLPTRKLDPASDRKAGDAVVELQPPDGKVTNAWLQRRVLDTHALLEDSGVEIGVSVVSGTGFQPILGQAPKDPGYLAAHTILGKPALTAAPALTAPTVSPAAPAPPKP